MVGYLAALPIIYIFIYWPLQQTLYGTAPPTHDSWARFLNSTLITTDEPLSCPTVQYTTHILSHEPLVIYIEKFLAPPETAHLLEVRLVTKVSLAKANYEPATVANGPEISVQTQIRASEVALLDRDETVRCLEHRARAFQGWRSDVFIERLRTQRYGHGGHYVHHYDWSGTYHEADRLSTFMVYVDAQCEGGGTEFPRLLMPAEKGRWCEFIECHGGERGVTFKPIRGNAIFWVNLRSDGSGYEETWHSGLPVTSGSKVGLNIWSWALPRDSNYGRM
ncbi:BgTH12-00938 [Blumeria graminis f. sp. triticale]|uniref:Bgt-2752 n=3 Tax=Blumeria graminis TaxID=34373 RepID=A0A381L8D3_BLUGR|nr:hypothetical protein BGT96224_2752 [Blumeria graminis f. sp. tritici 96224]CAD6505447.1 BgTH12-00938 [Blumeria graminis f. sp. triticale]VDB93583.1 Bgt-2752 [Blumeria graminis f. sp. tritici]